jgi:hypothetical protein
MAPEVLSPLALEKFPEGREKLAPDVWSFAMTALVILYSIKFMSILCD